VIVAINAQLLRRTQFSDKDGEDRARSRSTGATRPLPAWRG
jgi:hypothetical protein